MRKVTSRAVTSRTTISSGTSGTVLAANAERKAGSIYNEGPGTLYIKYGISPTTTSYKTQIATGEMWLIPTDPVWTGEISGWANTGNCVLALSEES